MATVFRTPTFRPTPPPPTAKSPKPSRIAVASLSTTCWRKPSLLYSLRFPTVPSLRFVRFVPFAFDGDTEAPQVQEPEVQVLVRLSLSIANAFVFCSLFISFGIGTNFEFWVLYLFGILAFSGAVQEEICWNDYRYCAIKSISCDMWECEGCVKILRKLDTMANALVIMTCVVRLFPLQMSFGVELDPVRFQF